VSFGTGAEGQQATPSRKIEQGVGAQQTPSVASQPSPPQAAKRIPLRLSGKSYIVLVLINGRIWLDFVLDTGADDVSIPVDVARTLMRTGTITKEDIGGEQSYGLADGGTVKGRQLRIRSLQIGEGGNAVIAQNVAGGTSGSQGSLLLGQSFLRQFRSTTIDHVDSVLIIDGSEPQPPVPTALQPAPATALQPAQPANAQRGPIPPPPVPQFPCGRPPPVALVLGPEYLDARERGCLAQFNIRCSNGGRKWSALRCSTGSGATDPAFTG
jgi:predicted aspartyl protease